MTEEDFIRLGEHLKALDPIVQNFCQRHAYERITGSSIGRYPRVRLQSSEVPTRWLDLWMGLNEEGQRFAIFSPDIPFELSAGASFVAEEGEEKWRYQHFISIWDKMPFYEVEANLPEALEKALELLSRWDFEYIRKNGDRILLP